MKKNPQNSSQIIWFFVVISMFTGCENSQKEQTTVKPSIQQGFEKIIPQPTTIPAKVTKKTKTIYQWYCSQCHGLNGKGDGINASFLTVPPRNHTKAPYLETRTDEQLFEAIKFGGLSVGRAPCMPAWGETLKDDTIQSLVQYIRELCQCEAL